MEKLPKLPCAVFTSKSVSNNLKNNPSSNENVMLDCIEDKFDVISHHDKLSTAIKWLATNTPHPPPIICKAFSNVFEEQLLKNYLLPINK